VQNQIVELLPEVLSSSQSFEEMSASFNELSRRLERRVNEELDEYGVACQRIQMISALPSKEILDALDAKTAISVVGSQKEYLVYKAANSLGAGKESGGNDPMQMMMGLMLGKGLLDADYHQKERLYAPAPPAFCGQCRHPVANEAKFCGQCGERIKA
jgi:membrane protease subunit (stomatin/prohibitin family)